MKIERGTTAVTVSGETVEQLEVSLNEQLEIWAAQGVVVQSGPSVWTDADGVHALFFVRETPLPPVPPALPLPRSTGPTGPSVHEQGF